MSKIRVLLCDDAVVVRRLVSDVLANDPELEVAGTAANGRIALAKITQVNPDIMILDMEMPEMDGLQTLAELRKRHANLPVIMFSTLTQRGAAATLDALSLGASDYVTKPANVGSVSAAQQRIREELIPKIKTLCRRAPVLSRAALPLEPKLPQIASNSRFAGVVRRVDVLTIGVSTGGPNALAALLPSLPAGFPVPILIVQHMPPVFTKLLADRLAAQCDFPVREAAAGERVAGPGAWIAPGDYHLQAVREADGVYLKLQHGPPENSCRPAVDVLFRSVAAVFGANTLAVILTGMGQDGLRGCERIREAGGEILVQDEATSVVWGMPGFVARAGLADQILPLGQLGTEIIRRVQLGRFAFLPN